MTFEDWYAGHAKKLGLSLDPDDPQHFYDYRAAFQAGAEPDKNGHWPSKFKLPGHPREIVDGIDTRTGQPVASTTSKKALKRPEFSTTPPDVRTTPKETWPYGLSKDTWAKISGAIAHVPLPSEEQIRRREEQGVRGAMLSLVHPTLGFLSGRLLLGLPDIPVSKFGDMYAKRKLRKDIERRGYRVDEVQLSPAEAAKLHQEFMGQQLMPSEMPAPYDPRRGLKWKISDSKGMSLDINPDKVVEGTYARDLGQVYASLVGIEVTPDMQLLYDVFKFYGAIKPVGAGAARVTKGIASPYARLTLQSGLTGIGVSGLTQLEDAFSKDKKFSFRQMAETGGWFALFGLGAAGVDSIRNAHVARSVIKENPAILKHLSKSEVRMVVEAHRSAKLVAAKSAAQEVLPSMEALGKSGVSVRGVEATSQQLKSIIAQPIMSKTAWMKRYVPKLQKIAPKLDAYLKAIKYKPPTWTSLPESTTGPKWYGKVGKVASKGPNKASEGQWLAHFKKLGVSQEELMVSGVHDVLAKGGKSIPKIDVLGTILDNVVELDETVLLPADYKFSDFDMDTGELRDVPGTAKYVGQVIPGPSENYKEILVKLPGDLQDYEVDFDTGKIVPGAGGFESSHWPGEVNVLGHIRADERIDVDGKSMFFVEEIQSDWHQRGVREGYGEVRIADDYTTKSMTNKQAADEFGVSYVTSKVPSDTPGQMLYRPDGSSIGWTMHPDTITKWIQEDIDGAAAGVPDAPFKKTWHELLAKRALREAVYQGKDKLAWTTGEQQIEMNQLARRITALDVVKLSDGTFDVVGGNKAEGRIWTKDGLKPEQLSKYFGDEITGKIKAQQVGEPELYSELDIFVGGEFHKDLYDKKIHQFLAKYTKRWGGIVEKTKLRTYRGMVVGGPEEIQDVWSLTITPEMKEAVLEGQPMFGKVEVGAAPAPLEPTRPELVRPTEIQRKEVTDLKGQYSLSDEALVAYANEMYGKPFDAMNLDEADDFIDLLSSFKHTQAAGLDAMAKSKELYLDTGIPRREAVILRGMSKSREGFNRVINYSKAVGGPPTNDRLPDLEQRRRSYFKNLRTVALRQRGAQIKREKARELDKPTSVVNYWSSIRYALAEAGQKLGVPLRSGFEKMVDNATMWRLKNAEVLESLLKQTGAHRLGAISNKKISNQIVEWMYEEDEKAKDLLWGQMDDITKKLAHAAHEFVKEDGHVAVGVRWERFNRWNDADKKAKTTILRLQSEGKAISKTRMKKILAPVKRTKPPDAIDSNLHEGRRAKKDGRLLDYLSTQTWGTRKHWFMTQQELKNMLELYPDAKMSEEIAAQVKTIIGEAPEPELPELMTRRGEGKPAKVGNVFNALLNHADMVYVTASTHDDLGEFWEAFVRSDPSREDVARMREAIRVVRGMHRRAEPWVKVGRGISVWGFWRPTYSLVFSIKRPTRFFTRNIFQNIAYSSAQMQIKEMFKTAAEFPKLATMKHWLDNHPKASAYMQEKFAYRIDQRRNIWRHFALQTPESRMGEFGTRTGAVLDMTSVAIPYSDFLNRSAIAPVYYRTAERNINQFIKGEISFDKMKSRLHINALHSDQIIEVEHLLENEKWDDAVEKLTEWKTENTHFRYQPERRSLFEMTPAGKLASGLYTFPKGDFEILYQNGIKPLIEGMRVGDWRKAWEGHKTIAKKVVGSRLARYLLYTMFGIEAYGIISTETRYTPINPGVSKFVDMLDDINYIQWRAVEEGKPTLAIADQVASVLSSEVELWIPYCDSIIDHYEMVNDVEGVRLYRLVKKKLLDDYKMKFRKAYRDDHEKFLKEVYGTAERGEEAKGKKRRRGQVDLFR